MRPQRRRFRRERSGTWTTGPFGPRIDRSAFVGSAEDDLDWPALAAVHRRLSGDDDADRPCLSQEPAPTGRTWNRSGRPEDGATGLVDAPGGPAPDDRPEPAAA